MVRCVRGNNHRIRDFDGFAPLSDGHTPAPDDPDQTRPPILGYVGPYRLGMIGREKPRWAVFADEAHLRGPAEETLKGQPRRSVELWTFANDPTKMYFDPIAALGSETPRLPLPVTYSDLETAQGVTVTRYSFVSPGASNTFISGAGIGKEKKRPKEYCNDSKEYCNDSKVPVEYDAEFEKKHPRAKAGKFKGKGSGKGLIATGDAEEKPKKKRKKKRKSTMGQKLLSGGLLAGSLAALVAIDQWDKGDTDRFKEKLRRQWSPHFRHGPDVGNFGGGEGIVDVPGWAKHSAFWDQFTAVQRYCKQQTT
jgi:hypothetical protein